MNPDPRAGVLSFALTQKKEPKKKSRLQRKFRQNDGSLRCENELASPPSARSAQTAFSQTLRSPGFALNFSEATRTACSKFKVLCSKMAS